MMLLHSLITLLRLCLWTEPIRSQQLQSCRLLLNFLHRKRSTAAKLYSPPPLSQPCSLLHARPLAAALSPAVITPAARDQLPLNCGQTLKQKTAVAFCCHNPYNAVVKSEKTHWFSPGTCQHLYLLRDQAEGFPRSLQTGLLQASTHTAMQLPLMLQMQLVFLPMPALGRPVHICMSMCLNTLMLGLQKCSTYRNRPSGRTQARWDTGQCQQSFLLFDLIWSLP